VKQRCGGEDFSVVLGPPTVPVTVTVDTGLGVGVSKSTVMIVVIVVTGTGSSVGVGTGPPPSSPFGFEAPGLMTSPPNPPSPIVTHNCAGSWVPNHGVYSGSNGQAMVVREVLVEPTDRHTEVSLHVVV
jgi:hypothetical protein